MRYLALSLSVLLAISTASAAEPLGRLFFTPAQRAQLDAARSQKSRAPLPQEEEEAAPVPEVVTYEGVVRRSDGKSTVWLNNHAINDGKAGDGLPVTGRVQRDGSITLQVPQANRNVRLKVGQSVEIMSGTIEEPYARRRVAAKPQPQPPRDAGGVATKPESTPPLAGNNRRDEEEDGQGSR